MSDSVRLFVCDTSCAPAACLHACTEFRPGGAATGVTSVGTVHSRNPCEKTDGRFQRHTYAIGQLAADRSVDLLSGFLTLFVRWTSRRLGPSPEEHLFRRFCLLKSKCKAP
jgi:hypothetical protein